MPLTPIGRADTGMVLFVAMFSRLQTAPLPTGVP